MKQFTRLNIFVLAVLLFGTIANVQSQTTSVFTAGLNRPTKVINADDVMLVSESGTATPNSGRISIIDSDSGVRSTLLSGLPSGVNNLGGPPDADGTTGICLRGRKLYVTSGVGDAVTRGPSPPIELPTGTPSSPLFDSALELTLPRHLGALVSGFTLTAANQATLAGGTDVVLTNAERRRLRVHLVANLPDFIPLPLPGRADNVKASHLFGVAAFGGHLYLADAGLNLIHRVNLFTGSVRTFVRFPNKPNPMFPMVGGPFIEAVPDNIHVDRNRLLVPLLTGFPFVPGFSEIQSVRLTFPHRRRTFIPNLTSAIDVLRVTDNEDNKDENDFAMFDGKDNDDEDDFAMSDRKDNDDEDDLAMLDGKDDESNSYYTLEFSANQRAGQPGRIRFFADPTASPVTVVPVVITPTSMVRDSGSGDIFVTNIFPGTLTRVQFP